MQAEQPTKLCKTRRMMRVKVSVPVIITDRPKAIVAVSFVL